MHTLDSAECEPIKMGGQRGWRDRWRAPQSPEIMTGGGTLSKLCTGEAGDQLLVGAAWLCATPIRVPSFVSLCH